MLSKLKEKHSLFLKIFFGFSLAQMQTLIEFFKSVL